MPLSKNVQPAYVSKEFIQFCKVHGIKIDQSRSSCNRIVLIGTNGEVNLWADVQDQVNLPFIGIDVQADPEAERISDAQRPTLPSIRSSPT